MLLSFSSLFNLLQEITASSEWEDSKPLFEGCQECRYKCSSEINFLSGIDNCYNIDGSTAIKYMLYMTLSFCVIASSLIFERTLL